jgi:hypothetical protein
MKSRKRKQRQSEYQNEEGKSAGPVGKETERKDPIQIIKLKLRK